MKTEVFKTCVDNDFIISFFILFT